MESLSWKVHIHHLYSYSYLMTPNSESYEEFLLSHHHLTSWYCSPRPTSPMIIPSPTIELTAAFPGSSFELLVVVQICRTKLLDSGGSAEPCVNAHTVSPVLSRILVAAIHRLDPPECSHHPDRPHIRHQAGYVLRVLLGPRYALTLYQ